MWEPPVCGDWQPGEAAIGGLRGSDWQPGGAARAHPIGAQRPLPH